ncbi:hypothetical protein GCM10027403_20480 [Arthrobacter tecti]
MPAYSAAHPGSAGVDRPGAVVVPHFPIERALMTIFSRFRRHTRPLDERTSADGHERRRTGKLRVTWALMAAAVVVVLLLPDWADTGAARPIWLFALPVVLGLVGAGFALAGRHPWWGVLSAVWGFVLIQMLVVITTLVSGP